MGYLASAIPPQALNGAVMHLACHVHGREHALADDIGDLAQTLATLNGRRLIFTSSAVLYDGWSPAPDEQSRVDPPRTWYTLTKQTQEEMIRLSGADAVILRIGSIMGPAPSMRWDLLPNRFVWSAVRERRIPLTMPTAWRPILGIHDAVRAIEWATTVPAGTYNILTTNMRVQELAGMVADLCGAQVDVNGALKHPPSFTMSGQLAQAHGFEPRDSIPDLIRELRDRAQRC